MNKDLGKGTKTLSFKNFAFEDENSFAKRGFSKVEFNPESEELEQVEEEEEAEDAAFESDFDFDSDDFDGDSKRFDEE